ncbi:MAG: extracellular solute-binding protein [Lachnospiraceae bacterium]|nr:extracellular solute-binding protein [Lachnospiraceae bacterium]MDD7026307.1 extracellular solute-binding protein [Lachnospiraceae bacterium]MDY5700560.1 extracellular solute-binding protein [Lachnospiraceae bacterium]
MKKFFSLYARRIYITLIMIFLYAPIATLIVLSFNASRSRAKWGGFTLDWYQALFQNETIIQALYNTLAIALLSSLIATIIGVVACIGINSMRRKGRTIVMGITNIPMLNADIVTGISLMLLFISLGVRFGFGTILLSHITFNIPYVILSVMPRMKQLNPSVYEAALDLGASPIKAYFKVVLPDLMPAVQSGFLMAFTMSLDDFIITHFTKGPGIDTLSTKIYTEVKKGIKPEMYALSTIIFISVLVLLLLVNKTPAPDRKLKRQQSFLGLLHKPGVKYGLAGLIILLSGTGIFYGITSLKKPEVEQVIVYNWGEYLDPEVIKMFEEETGIQVIYDEYETNEIMYPKIETGTSAYDVVCPSDYMIEKMIENDLLYEIDFKNIPNASNIGQQYYEQSKAFDPENRYSIPYCWGTVGILYNKTMVDEPVDSWSILWDEKYANNILMQDSVRDAFMVALKLNGDSMNSVERQELEAAKRLLIGQQPLVQAYVVDQVRDKMIGGEAALGVIYSGEAIYTQRENSDLEYVIPKEGTNVWIDSWVIPKTSKNKENAEIFINYMCRPDIALLNFEYITYSTPNDAARELIEDEDIRNSTIAFPDLSQYDNLETFHYIGEEGDALYNNLWKEVKSQ